MKYVMDQRKIHVNSIIHYVIVSHYIRLLYILVYISMELIPAENNSIIQNIS